MREYTYTSRTAGMTANGSPLGLGDVVKMSAEDERDPHNAAMIESGALVANEESKTEGKKSSEGKEDG